MPEWHGETLKKGKAKLSAAFRGTSARQKAIARFAKKHDLIYFHSAHPEGGNDSVLRGSSVSPGQVDTNFCIGSHAGYDMAFVERLASVAFEGYKTTVHRWYVLQIDLKQAHNLPFIFMGTKQQPKAYYARVLTAHRDARYLTVDESSEKSTLFHATYALLASPAELHLLYRLFTHEVIESVATYKYPFAVEIEGDSLIVMTEATKPSEQLLDELLHYGLWFAKEIDKRLV